MPVCDKNLAHNIYQYPFEDIGAAVLKELKMVEIIKLTLIKFHTFSKILNFCLKSNGADLQKLSKKIIKKEKAKITRIITEFKQNATKLKKKSSLEEYEFIAKSMQTMTKNYAIFYKFAIKIIAKHHFKTLKDKFKKQEGLNIKKTRTAVASLPLVQAKSIQGFKLYKRYMKKARLLNKKLKISSELKSAAHLNYRKITPKELVKLRDQYNSNIDILFDYYSKIDKEHIIVYYDFNLYESIHYKAVTELTAQKLWLSNCDQLTLGCYIHDREQYDNFMEHLFPNKVKYLKITYHKGMGELTKIWYDQEFRNNAGRVTETVRLYLLKLTKQDICEIFELFNHVKSIWF